MLNSLLLVQGIILAEQGNRKAYQGKRTQPSKGNLGFDEGRIWHSDTTYLTEPPLGAILVARELPPRGGDTLFANMVMAYKALSGGMKEMLTGLTAVNSSAKEAVAKSREDC